MSKHIIYRKIIFKSYKLYSFTRTIFRPFPGHVEADGAGDLRAVSAGAAGGNAHGIC